MNYGYGYVVGQTNLTSAQWAAKYNEACAAGKNQSTLAALANAYRTAAVAEGAAIVALSCANAPARPTGPFGRRPPNAPSRLPLDPAVSSRGDVGRWGTITNAFVGVLFDKPRGQQVAYLPIGTRFRGADHPLLAAELNPYSGWTYVEAFPFGQSINGWILIRER